MHRMKKQGLLRGCVPSVGENLSMAAEKKSKEDPRKKKLGLNCDDIREKQRKQKGRSRTGLAN